jgi:hypothetical protein
MKYIIPFGAGFAAGTLFGGQVMTFAKGLFAKFTGKAA